MKNTKKALTEYFTAIGADNIKERMSLALEILKFAGDAERDEDDINYANVADAIGNETAGEEDPADDVWLKAYKKMEKAIDTFSDEWVQETEDQLLARQEDF